MNNNDNNTNNNMNNNNMSSSNSNNNIANHHESEFFGGRLCVSDSPERVVVLAEVVVHPRSLDRSLGRLDLHVLAGGQPEGQKQAQDMPHCVCEKGKNNIDRHCNKYITNCEHKER